MKSLENRIDSPMDSQPDTQPDLLIRWLQLAAGLTGLIGILGLIALLSHDSWAQAPRQGFQPGPKTFTNPFANQPPPTNGATPNTNNNFFDDDESDDFQFDEAENVPPSGARPPGGPAGAGSPSNRGGDANGKGVSLGGGPPSGVVSGAPVKLEHVDNETGEGSKEVVTDFNFPDADILDIAKTLGKLTGKNFILDKDVKGRITIISNSAITVSDAWKAFLTALDMNGFALIPSGKYIRIARNRDARDKQLKTYTGDFSPDTDALITRVFPLKYISAEEVARTFRSFMPANSRIYPHEQTNTIIVTDTGSNIVKLDRILAILDIEGYDAGIEVIPVKFASAAELSKLIDTLIPGTGGANAGGPRFGGGGGGKFSSRRTKEGGIINTIIADERTNTLIVHANIKGADQVRELVAKLDQKLPANIGGGKVHVLYLQFADAEQIANTLNNLSQASAAKPSGPGGGTGVNPVATSLFEGSIKVSPDKATNSLVVTGTPADFVTVQRVVNRLDIPRDEVFAEVVIMEVSLQRDFNYSTNVINPASGLSFTPNSDLFDFIANPVSQRGAVLGFAAGTPRDITVGGQKVTVSGVQGLIKAIQTNSRSNVLATPQIIALDNTEASFESAEKLPVETATAVQGAIASTITKEPVSLAMKIKPQINKISNFVKLDVDTKLEDLSNRQLPSSLQGRAFATISRTAKTTVIVGDGDTVVIGGLIRDKITDSVSKIPLLGDIPLLGWLFRSKDSHTEKTNLLIFITPHIVRQYEKVRAILDQKLRERDEYLENQAGGEDPLRYKRDDMIRKLPDIKELTSRKPEAAVTIEGDKPAAAPVEPNANEQGKQPFTQGTPPAGAPGAPQAQPTGSAPNMAAPESSSNSAPPATIPPPPPPPTPPQAESNAPAPVPTLQVPDLPPEGTATAPEPPAEAPF